MVLITTTCHIIVNAGDVGIVKMKDKIMCEGYPIAKVLGYECPTNAIDTHIKPEWRMTCTEIINVLRQCILFVPPNFAPNTVFISVVGVCVLIKNSKAPAADVFKRWLFKDVLSELIKFHSDSAVQFNMHYGVRYIPPQFFLKPEILKNSNTKQHYKLLHNVDKPTQVRRPNSIRFCNKRKHKGGR